MYGLGVELRRHGLRREVFCVICGALYQQESVAAVLVRGEEALGDVCPRCLAEGPHRGGQRLRERAGRMAERAHRVLRRRIAGLADMVLDQADWFVALAEQLPAAATWGVTPQDVQRAERSALRERFPQLPDGVLSRLVEGRYRACPT